MKSLSDIKQLLKKIKDKFMWNWKENKKKWYKIRKYFQNENKLTMYKKCKL